MFEQCYEVSNERQLEQRGTNMFTLMKLCGQYPIALEISQSDFLYQHIKMITVVLFFVAMWGLTYLVLMEVITPQQFLGLAVYIAQIIKLF